MKKYIIALTVVLMAWSCNEDLLDIPQQGVLSAKDYYINADDQTATSFITAVYYKIRLSMMEETWGSHTGSTSALGLRGYLEKMGDDFCDGFLYTETAAGSTYSKIWSYHYSIIYWCNMIIENLPGNKVASEPVKTQVIAEARAIRAIMMMYLVQLYGTPPLADHIMTGTEGNTPAEESWAFINTELAEAAEGLPSKSGKNGQSAIGGRLTKEAVYAYLGKAYLWQKKYSEAASTLYNKVIATDLYELNPDFRELNRYTSDFCAEYMWECDISDNIAFATSQAGMMDAAWYNWSNIYYPDGFYTAQGWQNTCFPSESFGSFMDTHDVVGGIKTERYLGTLATYEDMLTLYTYEETEGKKGVKPGLFCPGVGYFRLRWLPKLENMVLATNWFQDCLHINLCYMRYAEVLLNYAEAVAMGGVPGAMSGLQALNLVRNRAGLVDAPALDMNNETYGIKAERRAELNWEGVRFIDLVRWGDAPTALKDVGKLFPNFLGYLDGNNSVVQSPDQWKILFNPTLGVGFKANKNELFPIPVLDMNNNPNLVQNQGW